MICIACSSDLVLVGIRQQREEARTLDRGGELALVEGACAGQAGRRDLAVLADEIAQHVDFLVVDLLDLGDREAAEALATEQQRLAVALRALVLGKTTFSTW